MIQAIIAIVAPLFIIIGVGYFYGARVRPEMRITNQLIMDVFMPALIFHVMIQDEFSPGQYLNLVIGGLVVMLGSGLVAYLFASTFKFSWRSFVPPAMFSNWANLGLPLYVFALGEVALGGGVMLVIVGNVLCFTLGVFIFSGKFSGLALLKTPIIIAVVLGVVFNLTATPLPTFFERPIEMLAQVAIPIMLFSLGVRLTHITWGDSQAGFMMAIFAPVVGVSIALLVIQVLPLSAMHRDILILFGVLPPAVMNFILAEQYELEPAKVASMVLIGNLSAIITIPLVLYFVLSS